MDNEDNNKFDSEIVKQSISDLQEFEVATEDSAVSKANLMKQLAYFDGIQGAVTKRKTAKVLFPAFPINDKEIYDKLCAVSVRTFSEGGKSEILTFPEAISVVENISCMVCAADLGQQLKLSGNLAIENNNKKLADDTYCSIMERLCFILDGKRNSFKKDLSGDEQIQLLSALRELFCAIQVNAAIENADEWTVTVRNKKESIINFLKSLFKTWKKEIGASGMTEQTILLKYIIASIEGINSKLPWDEAMRSAMCFASAGVSFAVAGATIAASAGTYGASAAIAVPNIIQGCVSLGRGMGKAAYVIDEIVSYYSSWYDGAQNRISLLFIAASNMICYKKNNDIGGYQKALKNFIQLLNADSTSDIQLRDKTKKQSIETRTAEIIGVLDALGQIYLTVSNPDLNIDSNIQEEIMLRILEKYEDFSRQKRNDDLFVQTAILRRLLNLQIVQYNRINLPYDQVLENKFNLLLSNLIKKMARPIRKYNEKKYAVARKARLDDRLYAEEEQAINNFFDILDEFYPSLPECNSVAFAMMREIIENLTEANNRSVIKFKAMKKLSVSIVKLRKIIVREKDAGKIKNLTIKLDNLISLFDIAVSNTLRKDSEDYYGLKREQLEKLLTDVKDVCQILWRCGYDMQKANLDEIVASSYGDCYAVESDRSNTIRYYLKRLGDVGKCSIYEEIFCGGIVRDAISLSDEKEYYNQLFAEERKINKIYSCDSNLSVRCESLEEIPAQDREAQLIDLGAAIIHGEIPGNLSEDYFKLVDEFTYLLSAEKIRNIQIREKTKKTPIKTSKEEIFCILEILKSIYLSAIEAEGSGEDGDEIFLGGIKLRILDKVEEYFDQKKSDDLSVQVYILSWLSDISYDKASYPSVRDPMAEIRFNTLFSRLVERAMLIINKYDKKRYVAARELGINNFLYEDEGKAIQNIFDLLEQLFSEVPDSNQSVNSSMKNVSGKLSQKDNRSEVKLYTMERLSEWIINGNGLDLLVIYRFSLGEILQKDSSDIYGLEKTQLRTLLENANKVYDKIGDSALKETIVSAFTLCCNEGENFYRKGCRKKAKLKRNLCFFSTPTAEVINNAMKKTEIYRIAFPQFKEDFNAVQATLRPA